ncbi:MAG TPA: DUF362 domain-containing protein, partial [Methanomicrobiales archaeon]|nr:DUF362 domain-containing protein [Methanomicrobiales archaeon]
MKYRVAVSRCREYEPDAVRAAVASAVGHLGGIGKFVGQGERVLVKPNLLASRSPEQAVTTHPAIARAVVELVQEAGGVPVLGDSPGGQNVGQS